jgi:hypothetical protein
VLATAHAAWVAGKARGKVVAVVGFDLSAAFDTIGREDLLPKMEAMGIRRRNLSWFRSYLTDARQCVVWDGQVSDTVDLEYGVRQGSLLGPVLYLLHVLDLPPALGMRDSDEDSGDANDTAVWVVAEDHDKALSSPTAEWCRPTHRPRPRPRPRPLPRPWPRSCHAPPGMLSPGTRQ